MTISKEKKDVDPKAGDKFITSPTNRRYRRRALLVGVRKFWNPDWELQGPENDVKNVYETLRINGFPRTGIKILINQKATFDNILKGIKWLTDGGEPGDVAFHYHSGHGTEVKDINGDEPNGYDQAIVCHDSDWDNGKMLVDDILFKAYSQDAPKDMLIETFFDTCYSGTATRSLSNRIAYRQRYLPPPFDIKGAILATPPSEAVVTTPGKKMLYDSQQENVHWSACTHNQVSYEDTIEGIAQGVGTYAWCKIFRKQEGNISREFLYEKANGMIYNELQYPQTMTLDVGRRKELLNRFPVRRVTEDTYEEVIHK